MRTVYLGTSPFAAAVLERLAASRAPPALVDHPARPAEGPRPRAAAARRSPTRARALGLELIQPEALHAPEVLERIAAAEPDALVVCALRRAGLGAAAERVRDLQRAPVAAAALARRRADRAGDHGGRRRDRRLDHAPRPRGSTPGPVCLRAAEPIRPDDDYGTLAARLQALGGELLVRALDERPPWIEQDEAGVTYAHKIEAADRALDPTRTPAEVERDGARAAPAHRRAAAAARTAASSA